MIKVQTGIQELNEYVNIAFEGDEEIVGLYDKSVEVGTVEDVCKSIVDKLMSVEDMKFFGVDVDGEKVGYFAYQNETLFSFGLNKKYRNKEMLEKFWDMIKNEIGNDFCCALFSYNQRAIKWLKKCGMSVLFENVTILKICQ